MNKKILSAVVLAGMVVASVAGATPMTEFHKGEGQIDVGGWQHGVKSDGVKGDSKIGFIGGATYGVADKIGVQYGYHDLTTGNLRSSIGGHLGGYQHEINALYSFAPNAAGYVGWNHIHANIGSDSTSNNIAQLGVVGKTPLTDKLDLYGNGAIGTKSTVMGEAGLGYAVSEKLDANFGYRYLRTKLEGEKTDWKGFFLGVTGKFGKPAEAADDYEQDLAPVEANPRVVTSNTAPVQAIAPQAAVDDYYFDSIHFDFDKDNIRPDQIANADRIVAAAKQTGHVFKLVGNTDGLGTNSYNDDLSRRRVDRVASYIKSHGIPSSQIVTQYKGKADPTQTNDTEAGRAANRRVDVFEHK